MSMKDIMDRIPAYHRGEITYRQLHGYDPIPEKRIESEEVISEPGAGIKITALKLTPAAQQALSVGNAVLPPYRREDMKLVKSEERLSDADKQEIAELQARNLMPLVYTICAGLIAYAGLVLYVALVS